MTFKAIYSVNMLANVIFLTFKCKNSATILYKNNNFLNNSNMHTESTNFTVNTVLLIYLQKMIKTGSKHETVCRL
jgi:hypothetical protein